MNVCVVGSGAREHAMALAASRSPKVKKVFVSPGNAGMAFEKISAYTSASFLADLRSHKIDLVLVGPDQALADGLVDLLSKEKIKAFGPTKAASLIEGSKVFSKKIMQEAGVKTSEFVSFTELSLATDWLRQANWDGYVIKADGLALGKGVVVCASKAEALDSVKPLFEMCGSILIEKKVNGDEISWMAFCDGETCSLFEPARDYKRLLNDHKGPNTGGMGSYAPVIEMNHDSIYSRVRETVFLPVLRKMNEKGISFKGILFAGLMFDERSNELNVLEFNARLGDPETQVLLPRLSLDFVEWCEACIDGTLSKFPNRTPVKNGFAVNVVLASEGYPSRPKAGCPISSVTPGMPNVFFAGVKKSLRSQFELETSGGRVLSCLGEGLTLKEARAQAYTLAKEITFDGKQMRTDVAQPEVHREKNLLVFASGRGSNFKAILDAIEVRKLHAKITALVCDRPEAVCLEIAKKSEIKAIVVPKKKGMTTREHEEKILKEVSNCDFDFVVLAGYMRIFSKEFIDSFRDSAGRSRMINVHPSLLPAFQGLHAYRQAFEAKVKHAGVSVHFVESEVDSGPLLAQKRFDISQCSSVEAVEALGLKIEHELYSETLEECVR